MSDPETAPCYRIVRYDDGPACPIAAIIIDDAGEVVATIARESRISAEYFAQAMRALDPTYGENEGGGGHPGDYPRK